MPARPTMEQRFRDWRAAHHTDRNRSLSDHQSDVFLWEEEQPVRIGRVEREVAKTFGGFVRWNGYCEAACHGVLSVTDDLWGADTRDEAVDTVVRAHWYALQGWSCSRIRSTLERLTKEVRGADRPGGADAR